MKRYFTLMLALVFVLSMAGCAAPSGAQSANEPDAEAPCSVNPGNTPTANHLDTETPGGASSGSRDILITYNGADTGEFYLTAEEAQLIRLLLEGGGWTDGLTDCATDVLLSASGQLLGYHSDCGTFVDRENDRSMTLEEEDRMAVNEIFERYMTLGISHVSPPEPEYDWGVTLTLKNLTRTGATIVCTQSGGSPTGELHTGSYYIVERLTENGWEEVEHRQLDGELVWTAEAWLVNMDGTTEWEVNWAWLYGELPDGHYRIGKCFDDFRGSGDYHTMMVYATFGFGTPDN